MFVFPNLYSLKFHLTLFQNVSVFLSFFLFLIQQQYNHNSINYSETNYSQS